jgi:redox-sensitive bicupin YhaK (pirin superfamily)
MTAGRGIVHSEMPVGNDICEGLQLWINLSKENKMIPPQYQELKNADIPIATKDGVTVKVIAGESMNIKVITTLIKNAYFYKFFINF